MSCSPRLPNEALYGAASLLEWAGWQVGEGKKGASLLEGARQPRLVKALRAQVVVGQVHTRTGALKGLLGDEDRKSANVALEPP